MQVELRPIDSIRPYPQNPRRNESAIRPVARSIQAYGWRQPVVVDEAGVIVAGHTRWLAAKELGHEQIPVHVATGLSPAQIKAYRLADNKLNTLASFDDEKLIAELMALREADYDLDLTGFTSSQLNELMGTEPVQGHTDPDDIPEHPEAITQPGDLWLLGDHRLLCGDATESADVAKLLAGQRAAMLWTDPPWGVQIGGDGNPRHRQRPGLVNDDLPPEELEAFLKGFAVQAARVVEGDVYVVLGASSWPCLDQAMRGCGFHWSASVIWVKDVFVLGRSKFHRRYEPIWYGWHKDGKSSFQGRRDVDDVWEIPRPRQSPEHPTMKPVELIKRAIEYSSAPGDLVLDLFGGSGSTMIAAEQSGRRAYLMEIDGHYVDVAARRWSEFTGKPAIRIDSLGNRHEHAFAPAKAAA